MPIFSNPNPSGITPQTVKNTYTLDFGFASGGEDTIASITIPFSTIYSNCYMNCVMGKGTPDHDPEDAIVEGIIAYTENIIPGVSFDIVAYASNGTWGRYMVKVTG